MKRYNYSLFEQSEPDTTMFDTMQTVVLRPLSMRIPNDYYVYSPCDLSPTRKISYQEFKSKYAYYPQEVRVCFNKDVLPEEILKESQLITAYGHGIGRWYILESEYISLTA